MNETTENIQYSINMNETTENIQYSIKHERNNRKYTIQY